MDFGAVIQTNPPASRTVHLAKLAEQYGFSHVWTFDSHILWQEPYVIYSQILAETRKVKVGPFTTSVSPVVMPEARLLEVELDVPDSSVEPVMTAGVVLSLLTTEPVTGALATDGSSLIWTRWPASEAAAIVTRAAAVAARRMNGRMIACILVT